MSDPLQLTLFLKTRKGLRVLQKMLRHLEPGHIRAVISAPDQGLLDDAFPDIQSLCRQRGLAFYQRKSAPRFPNTHQIAVGWRWLIRREAQSPLWVFHDSLLPQYRGFTPLVTALIQGESRIGATVFEAVEDYDKGPIIYQESRRIDYPIRIAEAEAYMAEMYEILAQQLSQDLLAGRDMPRTLQNESAASYSLWRDEADYRLDWQQSAGRLARTVDALGYPYPGATSQVNGQTVRILAARALPDVQIAIRQPGKVLFVKNSKPIVVCGQGLLEIQEMVDDEDRQSRLPLAAFRTRFS